MVLWKYFRYDMSNWQGFWLKSHSVKEMRQISLNQDFVIHPIGGQAPFSTLLLVLILNLSQSKNLSRLWYYAGSENFYKNQNLHKSTPSTATEANISKLNCNMLHSRHFLLASNVADGAGRECKKGLLNLATQRPFLTQPVASCHITLPSCPPPTQPTFALNSGETIAYT